MKEPRVIGLAGWSGSGKTTLLVRLIPLLVQRGVSVATIKHAHHDFDVDTPGKDSHKHRAAGAGEVIVSSSRRWVQMHELGSEAEPSLALLLERVSPCGIVLVEGFKHEGHRKLEVHRRALGKPLLFPDDPQVVAIASDAAPAAPHPPHVDLNDTEAVARCVLEHAEPLGLVLARLRVGTPQPRP